MSDCHSCSSCSSCEEGPFYLEKYLKKDSAAPAHDPTSPAAEAVEKNPPSTEGMESLGKEPGEGSETANGKSIKLQLVKLSDLARGGTPVDTPRFPPMTVADDDDRRGLAADRTNRYSGRTKDNAAGPASAAFRPKYLKDGASSHHKEIRHSSTSVRFASIDKLIKPTGLRLAKPETPHATGTPTASRKTTAAESQRRREVMDKLEQVARWRWGVAGGLGNITSQPAGQRQSVGTQTSPQGIKSQDASPSTGIHQRPFDCRTRSVTPRFLFRGQRQSPGTPVRQSTPHSVLTASGISPGMACVLPPIMSPVISSGLPGGARQESANPKNATLPNGNDEGPATPQSPDSPKVILSNAKPEAECEPAQPSTRFATTADALAELARVLGVLENFMESMKDVADGVGAIMTDLGDVIDDLEKRLDDED
ncbi:hypothetical protein AAE478_007112 [Parahypoxylon ruwenzoriense]